MLIKAHETNNFKEDLLNRFGIGNCIASEFCSFYTIDCDALSSY